MAHKLLIQYVIPMVICAVIIGGGFVSGMPSLASDYYPIRPPRPPLLHDNFEAGDPLTEEEFHSDISSKTGEMELDDSILWDNQHPELHEGDVMLSSGKNAILSTVRLWPNATIPYVISSGYTSTQRKVIASVMNIYQNKTCLRFVPRTTQANYIRIRKSGQGCWSYVGRIGGAQDVSLDDGCIASWAPGVVVHELMHTAGFWHEHMRPDRDKYVSINLNNVRQEYRGNFNKMSTTQVTTLGLAYDYGSVMHYPARAFAVDRRIPVIKALIGSPVLGQRKGFSTLDLQKLKKLYSCKSR
ncbi:hatching enzyme 1.2 [Daphnia magna]|uniref:hatching enzyme 1.2 n=1 Tax=Daphnia magna TaxID=35525 RepID=UPI001E1BC80A|nr:hatching enzyme 1.2 [Daphnia magna]